MPDWLLISIFTASVTSSLWCVRGVMSMLTPTLRYVNDVIGCWLTPPVAIGANVTCGTGTSSPNLRLRRQAVRRAQLRIGEDARVAVLLQQPVVEARQVREEDVALAQVGELLEGQPALLVDVDLPGDADVVARRENLDAVLLESRAIDLEQLDVDDHFGARLVDGAISSREAASMRSGVSLIEIALVAVIGDSRRASTTMRSRSSVSLRSALLR